MVRLLVMGLTILAGVAVWAQTPTFRGGIDLISFGVTVSSRDGTYVTDLSSDDFELLEDGRPQIITYFSRGETGPAAPDMHVGLLFDTSGSMTEDIALARTAAIRFLNTLRDARDMTLVDFDTEVRLSRYAQQDFPRLVERIRNRRPSGFTAMYDALGVYLDAADDDGGRTILVLYTDGGDTRSTISFSDVMTLVRASDATIYTIGFLQNQSNTVRVDQRAKLTQLAQITGGQAFFPVSMKDIETAYDAIVAQIRAQYSLGYTSTNTKLDGRWRKVEIRLKRPDLRNVRLQSRGGYFAPYVP